MRARAGNNVLKSRECAAEWGVGGGGWGRWCAVAGVGKRMGGWRHTLELRELVGGLRWRRGVRLARRPSQPVRSVRHIPGERHIDGCARCTVALHRAQ